MACTTLPSNLCDLHDLHEHVDVNMVSIRL